MPFDSMSFDSVPIWGVFLATIVLIMAAVEVGYLIGGWEGRKGGHGWKVSAGMISTTMGLVAFIIGFTFNSAAGRHDARKALLTEDVKSISTTWMRVELLREPRRTELRRLLVDYVDVRANVSGGALDLATAIVKSDSLHDRMWAIASALGQQEPGSIAVGLFASSLNEMIDSQVNRATAYAKRVPSAVWMALYLLTFIGMLMLGMQAGMDSLRQSGLALAMAVAFSIVLSLILDLDRPTRGYVNVSQQVVLELQAKMHGAAPTAPRLDTSGIR